MRIAGFAVVLFALTVALVSCTSIAKMGIEEMTGEKADIEVIKPIAADLKTYKSVEVERFESGVGGLVPAALVDGMQGEVIAKIKERGLFEKVAPATGEKPAAPTLLVGGLVTDYKQPDKGVKRVISKVALFSVNAFVKDKGSGEEIGRAIARGRLTTMFRGDETTLMQEAAKSVARFINEAHTPTPSKMEKMKGMMKGK